MAPQSYPTTVLEPGDHARWTELWRGYLTFYETELPAEIYEATWKRIMDPGAPIRALGVRGVDGRLLGIAHYFTHPHAWSLADACYLQDLFVEPGVRGRGYATALINGVAAYARAHGCYRLYWHTKEDNSTARRLYDHVAKLSGFVRYDFTL